MCVCIDRFFADTSHLCFIFIRWQLEAVSRKFGTSTQKLLVVQYYKSRVAMVIGTGVRVHIAICGYQNSRRRIIIRRREREKPVNTNLRLSGTNKKESKVLKVYVQGPPPKKTPEKQTDDSNRTNSQKRSCLVSLMRGGRETEKSPVIKMALWLHVPISHLCQTNCLELTLWLHQHICTCKRSKMPNISMFIFQKTLLTKKIFHKNYFVVNDGWWGIQVRLIDFMIC